MKKQSKQSEVVYIGIILIMAIIAFYVYDYFKKQNTSAPSTHTITNESNQDNSMFIPYTDLIDKMQQNKNYIFFDIRSDDRYSNEHIPQSIHVSPDNIDAMSIGDNITNIILVGEASDNAVFISTIGKHVQEKYKIPTSILQGGFDVWKQSGGKTISTGDIMSAVDHSKIHFISPEELKKTINDNPQSIFIVDMRPSDAFAKEHIKSSVSLPLAQLEQEYTRLPAGLQLIVFGNSETEDFQAGVRLFDLHFFSVKILKGGFNAWKNQKFETE